MRTQTIEIELEPGSDAERGSVGPQRYAVAVGSVLLAFLIRYFLSPLLGDELPFLFFIAAVLLATWYGGLGPGIVSLSLGILMGVYFIVTPGGALNVSETVDELRLARYFITGSLGIALIEALHRSRLQVQMAAQRVQEYATGLECEVEERKRSEAALQEAKVQLRYHASKLEQCVAERTVELRESLQALEGVLYHIAHDLRAPLRAMEGFSSILLKEHALQLGPQGEDYARRVSGAANRMDQLLQGLLEYGRLAHANLRCTRVESKAAVASALDRLNGTIKATGADISIQDPLPQVWAHSETLELVLLHLVKNALTFVPPWNSPSIRIWSERRPGKVLLWIADNGIGIQPEYQHRIFWVFERLHPTYPGIGIGLALVAKAMQRMQGNVGVQSSPGKGSRFWLEFPDQ